MESIRLQILRATLYVADRPYPSRMQLRAVRAAAQLFVADVDKGHILVDEVIFRPDSEDGQ